MSSIRENQAKGGKERILLSHAMKGTQSVLYKVNSTKSENILAIEISSLQHNNQDI